MKNMNKSFKNVFSAAGRMLSAVGEAIYYSNDYMRMR